MAADMRRTYLERLLSARNAVEIQILWARFSLKVHPKFSNEQINEKRRLFITDKLKEVEALTRLICDEEMIQEDLRRTKDTLNAMGVRYATDKGVLYLHP